MAGDHPQRLPTTMNAVRELMLRRLEMKSLDGESAREVEMALEELDVMWEELQGQTELLWRENQRYAEFFDYAPDPYLITDAGATIREANRAATELFGCAREGLVGKPLGAFLAAPDRVAFLSRIAGLQSGAAQPLSWRARVQPQAGAALQALFSVRAIPLRKSGVGGLCWLVRKPES